MGGFATGKDQLQRPFFFQAGASRDQQPARE